MALNIPLLPEGCLQFPDPRLAIAEHDGLVAVSWDLTAQRLLAAYQQGIFPWFEEDGLFFGLPPRRARCCSLNGCTSAARWPRPCATGITR